MFSSRFCTLRPLIIVGGPNNEWGGGPGSGFAGPGFLSFSTSSGLPLLLVPLKPLPGPEKPLPGPPPYSLFATPTTIIKDFSVGVHKHVIQTNHNLEKTYENCEENQLQSLQGLSVTLSVLLGVS